MVNSLPDIQELERQLSFSISFRRILSKEQISKFVVALKTHFVLLSQLQAKPLEEIELLAIQKSIPVNQPETLLVKAAVDFLFIHQDIDSKDITFGTTVTLANIAFCLLMFKESYETN